MFYCTWNLWNKDTFYSCRQPGFNTWQWQPLILLDVHVYPLDYDSSIFCVWIYFYVQYIKKTFNLFLKNTHFSVQYLANKPFFTVKQEQLTQTPTQRIVWACNIHDWFQCRLNILPTANGYPPVTLGVTTLALLSSMNLPLLQCSFVAACTVKPVKLGRPCLVRQKCPCLTGGHYIYTFRCILPTSWAILGWICALYKSSFHFKKDKRHESLME
jgi:hypothetical protein